jgi:hypothetical protein
MSNDHKCKDHLSRPDIALPELSNGIETAVRGVLWYDGSRVYRIWQFNCLCSILIHSALLDKRSSLLSSQHFQ